MDILLILLNATFGFAILILSTTGPLSSSASSAPIWKRLNSNGKKALLCSIFIFIISIIQIILDSNERSIMEQTITDSVDVRTKRALNVVYDGIATSFKEQGYHFDSVTGKIADASQRNSESIIKHQSSMQNKATKAELHSAKQSLYFVTEALYKKFGSETGFNKYLSSGSLAECRNYREAKEYLSNMFQSIVEHSGNLYLIENPIARRHWNDIKSAIDVVANYPYDQPPGEQCLEQAMSLVAIRENSFPELLKILANPNKR